MPVKLAPHLYFICIVLWSRISIELVDITKSIGTN